jgi:hypothetical protein
MKERRNSGATHSFRLSPAAARIVDNINHPRRMGGKSRKISDAIEWYFAPRGEEPSYDDLLRSIAALQKIITEQGNELKNLESKPRSRGIWSRFFTRP